MLALWLVWLDSLTCKASVMDSISQGRVNQECMFRESESGQNFSNFANLYRPRYEQFPTENLKLSDRTPARFRGFEALVLHSK